MWIVYCWNSRGILYDRRPYLSEAKAKEAVRRFRRLYPSRRFEVEYIHGYWPKSTDI